ncbi:uncharacterized protein LOC111109784 [Crassostrea virginica]
MDMVSKIVNGNIKWIVFFMFITGCNAKYCYTTATGAYQCQYTYGGGETGEIAGYAIGGAVGLAVVIGIVVCCVTKCNKKKKPPRSRPTRVQVSEANRRDHMPAESMPMYGMFSMGVPPPLPEYAPPSYDSHNFNHPPPRTQVTVSAGQDSNSYSHPPPRAPPIAEHDPHIYSQPPPTVSFTVSSGHGLHDSGIGSQSNDLLPPAY